MHRLPREPSAPRIGLWRSIRRLGAVLLGDGLVALPATARTVEHFEWLAAGIKENGGNASVWVARSTSREDTDSLQQQAVENVEEEFASVIHQAALAAKAPEVEKRRSQRRLRRQVRLIASRDFFDAPSGPRARQAVEDLAAEPARDMVPA